MTDSSGDGVGPDRDPHDGADGALDPLLDDPAVPTGQTGAIERPGDDRPAWLVPIMAAVLIGFVAVLAAVAAQRDETRDQTASTEPAETDSSTEPTGGAATSVPPTEDTTDTVPDVGSTVEVPVGSGTIAVDGDQVMIVSACEDHRPFAPADDSIRTSTYAFRDAEGALQIIHRRVEPGGADGQPSSVVEWIGRGLSGVVPSGDPVGPFDVELTDGDGGVSVSVSADPAGSNGLGCDSLVVTNEPGQFAFPTSRVVMAACSRSDDPVAVSGLLSSGGRFDAAPAGASTVTVELRLVDPRIVAGETVEYVDAAADAFVDADQRSFSGLAERTSSVEAAPASLDVTVDVRARDLPPCGDTGP